RHIVCPDYNQLVSNNNQKKWDNKKYITASQDISFPQSIEPLNAQ
ncbi:395_t:CDS:1, partial [Funneliformis mosseae]